MKHIIPSIILLFFILICSTGHAQANMDIQDEYMIETEEIQPDVERMVSGPLNSLTLSAGAMGSFYITAGSVLDLTYYRQTNEHIRHGMSLRWFHDFAHKDLYTIGKTNSGAKYAQIEMISAAYNLQAFKKVGNWEFSIAGGFGLGMGFSYNHGKKQETQVHVDDDYEGGMDLSWLLYGFYGDNWDFYFDISATGAIEYYIGENFSLGLNASIHYHTIAYADFSLSAQLKILF